LFLFKYFGRKLLLNLAYFRQTFKTFLPVPKSTSIYFISLRLKGYLLQSSDSVKNSEINMLEVATGSTFKTSKLLTICHVRLSHLTPTMVGGSLLQPGLHWASQEAL
jgi:hypothetical protein